MWMQLGFRQAILIPFFDSVYCGTSYRFHSPSKAIFRASKCSLEVMTKIAHKPIALKFECTSLFTTWWEAKWSYKYGGDIREAYDIIFEQVFFKSLPKKELESWNEAINEKNQLLLICDLSCYSIPLIIWL